MQKICDRCHKKYFCLTETDITKIYRYFFIAFICNANSQTITLTGDPIDGGDNLRDEDVDMEDLGRDLSITDAILPVLTFDSGRDEISIISTAVTFENVEYEICNEVGTTYISGMLFGR